MSSLVIPLPCLVVGVLFSHCCFTKDPCHDAEYVESPTFLWIGFVPHFCSAEYVHCRFLTHPFLYLARLWQYSSLPGSYEFSEADAACALQAIDSWVDGAAHGAQHISPEKVFRLHPQHAVDATMLRFALVLDGCFSTGFLAGHPGEVAVDRVRHLRHCAPMAVVSLKGTLRANPWPGIW